VNSDEAYISRVLESLFSGLRYTRYRTDAQTGKLNADGTLNTDVSDGLAPPYIWVRFGEDRAAVPVLSKIRDGAGIPVIVAFDTLINEDVVLEVNLARAIPVYGESATAYNIPVIPAGFFTPTNARDVQPGSLRADTTGGLNTRIVPCWLPGGTWWDGGTIITLVPTATSSKQSFAVVGIDSTGAVVQDLSADRALTYPLIDAEGNLTALGATDIQAVTDADPTVFWVGAALLANGATSIDGSRIYDTRFWRPPTMAGADGSAAGAVGFVPTPAAADNTKFLRGDATWATVSGGTSLPVFGAGVTKTLASDVAAAGSDRHLILAAQTSVTDDLIEITGLSAGEEVIIRADAGDTITVKHNSGSATDKIILHNATDIALSGDMTLKLVKTVSGKVVQYFDEAGTGSGGITHTYVGYNTAGGSNTAMLGGRVYMKKITLASAGWLGSIAAYIDHSAATNVQNLGCWVLTDNAGTPDIQFAFGAHRGSATFFLTTTARWVDMAMGVYLAAGDYWLCVQRGVDSGSDLRIYYDGSGTDKTQAIANNWSADGSQYAITDTTNKYSIRGSILT
jgi:hypothetical protein